MLLQTDISCDWEIKACEWQFLQIVSVFQKENFPSFHSFERIALETLSELYEIVFLDGTKKPHKFLYILRCPDVVHPSWMRKARR